MPDPEYSDRYAAFVKSVQRDLRGRRNRKIKKAAVVATPFVLVLALEVLEPELLRSALSYVALVAVVIVLIILLVN